MNEAAEAIDTDDTPDSTAETAPETTDKPTASMADAVGEALKAAPDEPDGDGDEPPAEPEAEAEAAEGDDPGPDDGDDDIMQVPEGTKPATAARMHRLIDTLKEKDSQLEQQTQLLTGFQKMIRDASDSPQQFSELLGFARNLRGDEQAKRQALAFLDKQRTALALELGVARGEFDALAEYPDLREAVDNMDVTEAMALEIARARQREKQNGERQQQQATQQQEQRRAQEEQEAYKARVTQGANAIDSLVKSWKNDDIDWAAKEPLLLKEAERIAQTMEPEHWGYALELAYKAAAAHKPEPRRPSALRPNGGGDGKKKPASMLEAISAAVGEPAG